MKKWDFWQKKNIFGKPTKNLQKNRQKPINFFGPSARPTKTDSEKGLSVYNPDSNTNSKRQNTPKNDSPAHVTTQ